MTYARMAWNGIVVGVLASWIAACEYKVPIGSNDAGDNDASADVMTPTDASVDVPPTDARVPTECGGFLGATCPVGQFCEYAIEATCGNGDQVGTCRTIPDVCPDNIDRVCGCDGQTYANACLAAHAGVSVAHAGACQSTQSCGGFPGATCAMGEFCDYPAEAICGNADGTGFCRTRPSVCDTVHDPVCGCDGITYANECEANRAGVSAASHGACTSARSCGGFGGGACAMGEFCQYASDAMCGAADQTGTCQVPPIACPTNVDVVCGCDGHNYNNECEAHRAGTSVSSHGSCPMIDDCRTAGCAMGSECSACLAPSGTVYTCIPHGSAC